MSLHRSVLMRRSIGRVSLAPASISDLRNEDDLDRSQRSSILSTKKAVESIHENSSLNESIDDMEVSSHLQMCTQLYASNKITAKNAWSLRIIDCIRKISAGNEENIFQIIATSLDISAKVYILRVDDLYETVLKMASKMNTVEGNPVEQAELIEQEVTMKRTRRKKRMAINTENITLETNVKKVFDTVKLLAPPSFQTTESIESAATDNLLSYQAMVISNRNTTLLSTERVHSSKIDEILKNLESTIDCDLFKLEKEFSICLPFESFEIKLDHDEETTNFRANEDLMLDENRTLVAELDGPPPDLYTEDDDYQVEFESTNEEESIIQRHTGMEEIDCYIPEQYLQLNNKYGYNSMLATPSGKLINRLWVGPSHWKVKFNRPASLKYTGSKENCAKIPRRVQAPQLLDFSVSAQDNENFTELDIKSSKPVRRALQKNLLLDVDSEEFNNLCTKYLSKPVAAMVFNRDEHVQIPDIEVRKFESLDTSIYCPVGACDADEINSYEEQIYLHEERNMDMENLVDEPEFVPENHITYALRAKKMDMKHLKTSEWSILTKEDMNGNVKMLFSHLYKRLPEKLKKEQTYELSVELAFVTVLHLCNENSLNLVSIANDFIIQGPSSSYYFAQN